MDLLDLQAEDLSGYIPCEFCDRLISFDDIILHQTECRPDIACGIDLTVDELQAQVLAFETFANERSATNSPEILSTPEPSQQNILPSVNTVVVPKPEVEKTTQQKDNRDEFDFDDHFVIPEDDIIQDNKTTFTFGSSKKEKREEEEEKPSFKAPPNPILNIDSKQIFHNQLTESDNEDNESLEDFWKRADIKLSQRMRMIQKKTTDRKI